MVVSDQGSHDRLASGVVVPDGGGQGQEALQDADGHPAWGVAAVAFEIELALEGIVDRLDDLAQRLEEPGAGRLGLALAAGRSRRSPAAARTASAVNMASRASRPSALAPVRAKATAGRAGCRPGAAATPRSTANAKRSTRTRPTRPGQSALRCRGSGRTPPGWNPPPRRRRSTAWCRRPGRGCSAGSAPRRHAAACCTGLLRQVREQVPQVRVRVTAATGPCQSSQPDPGHPSSLHRQHPWE